MERRTSKITAKSIQQSGLPSDYKKALAEYIWNGFDAGADTVSLDFSANALGGLEQFSISDNGSGIDVATIDDTFGNFLDSGKRDLLKSGGFQRGRKGKGRYAFSTFAARAGWSTRFVGPQGKVLSYRILISRGDLQHFSIDDRLFLKDGDTGTVVAFFDFFDLSGPSLESVEFRDFLAGEFGWFLFLNRHREFRILINGLELAYRDTIGDSRELVEQIGEDTFRIVFIRWNRRIGDRYFFYFLGSNQRERARKHTSFNNRAIEFHHSVYIESAFFDGFLETEQDVPVLEGFGSNQAHPSFRALLKLLNGLVFAKEKEFIREVQAERLVGEYAEKGFLPEVGLRHERLEQLLRELYCADPRIFAPGNSQQGRVLVGTLNLLLQKGGVEDLVGLVAGVAELGEEERDSLRGALE